MKKVLSILMSFLLLWSLALPAAAAETAATLRLEKTEGTVKVSNASGKSVTITKGMRLYSGYTIATEKNSYAYVSLDSTKAVKLDASSKAVVQKSGKKLELSLSSGNLFFNVSAPLEKDESLNIRTSTMVTGVRGTSGWVKVTNRFTSSVQLLEGTLTVTSSEPATGQMRQATITSGQTATAILQGTSQPGSQVTLTVGGVQEKLVPGFVAVEVEKDPVLQQKIAAKSPLSVPAIIGDAQERLAEEQKAADTAQKTLDKELDKLKADDVKQVFESKPAVEEDDDDDDEPYVPPVTPPTTPETPPETPPESTSGEVLDLKNPSAELLASTLSRTDVARVNVIDAGGDVLGTSSYAVRADQTLSIQSGIFTVGSGQTLTVTQGGTLEIAGGSTTDPASAGAALQIDGTVTIDGIATNSGSITVNSSDSLHIAGTLTNRGSITAVGQKGGLLDIQANGTLNNESTIQIGDTAGFGTLKIQKSGTLNNSSGSITIAENSSVTNAGIFTNAGTISNSGEFLVDASVPGTGTFTCSGTYTENRKELCAMAKSSDGTVYYLGPASEMSIWYANTTVTLLGGEEGPIEICPPVTVPGVTLNLNGRQVSLSSPLMVASDTTAGQLTITDTSQAGNGCLQFSGTTVQVYGGVLVLEGGTVISTDGTAVETQSGSVTVSGGAIEGYTCGINIAKEAKATIGGGTVTLTAPLNEDGLINGYAVSGPFTFSGGILRAKGSNNLIDPAYSQQIPYAVGEDTEKYFTAIPNPPQS